MIDSQPVETVQDYKTMQVELVRVDDAFHFEAVGASGVTQHIDAATDIGGHNAGARPMEMLLMGLAGCSAIDIVLILKKQKQVVDDFRMKVDGLRGKDAMPSPFKKIHITYLLKGKLDPEKVKRAIDLSMDKYCSATAQFRPSTDITYSFEIQ
jgi:putative redox protein